MFIHDMTEAECRYALRPANVGRLACARDNQPYVVPVYFAYSDNYLYAVSTVGQKIDWMRANPLVCVEVDTLTSHEEWMSLLVFGRFEELTDLPEYKTARELALGLLLKRSSRWWEPPWVCGDHGDMPHPCIPVAYRIQINRMTGHHATSGIPQTKGNHLRESPVKNNWFASLFGGWWAQNKGKDLR